MDELYFWLCAVIVGLLLLKLLPADKLKAANKKMHEKLPSILLTVFYILIFVLLYVAALMLTTVFEAPDAVKNIITGSILGAFIGLIPLVDKRYSE